MSHVFVSYRRDDTSEMACMLSELMRLKFGAGSVFVDVNEIPFGVDFRDYISEAVAKCKVLLAIIGDNWFLAETDKSKRRIDDPADFVRVEIKAALERGIPVIPVLVGNAKMPAAAELPEELEPLAYRNAAELRSGRDLRNQVNDLISHLAAHLKAKQPSGQTAGKSDSATHDLLEQLARILPPSNIAEPPGDLGLALRKGKGEVGAKLAELATAMDLRPLSLDDVETVISLAISHGAGIYNHPDSPRGRIGCGEIYFLAATGLLELGAKQLAESPPSGPSLALGWLKSIVDAARRITIENGDDVAWQLRYCFDSIPLVPDCDEITMRLHNCARRADPLRMTEMIRQVVESGRDLPPHVCAYFLRHATQVLLGLFDRPQFQEPAMNRAAERLSQLEALNAPIHHFNAAELRNSLGAALINFCQDVEADSDNVRGNGGGNGRGWFGWWKKR